MTDDELDEASRAVIEICREGDRLPPSVRAAVWRRLEPELAPAPSVHGRRWVWIGVAVAAAAVLAVAIERSSITRDEAAAPELAPRQHEPIASPQALESATPRGSMPEPATLPEVVDEPAPREPAAAVRPNGAREGRARTSAPLERPPAPTPAATGETELALVRGATAATQQGNPTRALALLDEAQRRFGDGALMPERAAARVLALCADAQRAQARREAAAFVGRWPDSPLVARVRHACAETVTDGSSGGL